MVNIQDIINNRRTIFRFTDATVDDKILNQALLAASNAPCHKHTHPWRFYVLGSITRTKLIPATVSYTHLRAHET